MSNLRVFLQGREITPSPLPVESEDEAAQLATSISKEYDAYVDDLICEENGNFIAILILNNDITQRDRAQEERNQKAYEAEGCANRQEYLQQLTENTGVDSAIVDALADVLGPNEDFDGLISALEDIS